MALYVENGVIRNNNKRWKRYRILSDEIDRVYEIKLDNDDNLYLEEVDKPEKNDPLEDTLTGINYFFAIRDRDTEDTIYEPILYLDSYECTDMCETIHSTNEIIKELQIIIVNMELNNGNEDQLEVTSNGWKLI